MDSELIYRISSGEILPFNKSLHIYIKIFRQLLTNHKPINFLNILSLLYFSLVFFILRRLYRKYNFNSS
ncbi:hypothetical protein ALT1000_500016 [Alteromonas macleodii]